MKTSENIYGISILITLLVIFFGFFISYKWVLYDDCKCSLDKSRPNYCKIKRKCSFWKGLPSTGIEGEKYKKGNKLYKFMNGKWVHQTN